MVDLSAKIQTALNEIDGLTVYYFAPSDWNALPAASYFEVKNAEYERAGGREYLSEILYQVDIWSESRSGNALVSSAVDQNLQALGLKRESSADAVENESGLHHRTMQYGCIANQNGQIFQKTINKKE